jgi:NADH-quinone oxidoreductase subunit C
MSVAPILDLVRSLVPDAACDAAPSSDMPTMTVDREHLVDVCRVLRDHPDLQFVFLADLTAADYLPAEPRFEMVYHLASLGAAYPVAGAAPAPARRLRVKSRVPGHDARVDSLVGVYPAANWPEREVYDLFGIVFTHHPDLRRILTPEDWTGHPLRRDYPVQVKKDAQAWQPVQVTAEEFAANLRAQRDRADRLAGGGAPREPDAPPR